MNTIDTKFFEQVTKQVEGLPNVEAMVAYTTAYIRRYIVQNITEQQGLITIDATIPLARTNNTSGMGSYSSTKTLECIDVHLPPNTVEPPTRGMVRLENVWEAEHSLGGDEGHDVFDFTFSK